MAPPPPVFLVSVGVASLAAGDQLSPAAERSLPEVVETVARILAEHGRA